MFPKKLKKSNSAAKGIKQNTALLEHISPIALDFGKKEMIFGERYAQGMVLVGYPLKAGPAWLSALSGLPGVIVSVHIVPGNDKEALIKSINRSIEEHRSRLSNAPNAYLEQEAQDNIKDGYKLIKKIREEQNVFDMVVTLLITADDKEGLDRKTRQLQATLSSFSMKGRIAVDEQEQALRACGPWAILPEEIYKMGKRNMSSETVAASFPFVSTTLNDGKGIILGKAKTGKNKDATGGGVILLDMWNKGGVRPNSNWVILAMSGTGKSFTLKLICLREYIQGSKVIVIDPERENKVLCKSVAGNWINAAGGKSKINPLQIRTNEMVKEDDEEEEEETTLSPLALHLQKLKVFMKLYLQELSVIEEKFLMKAVTETYADKGITFETDPRSLTNEEWPTLKDVWEKLVAKSEKEEEQLWKKLALLLEDAAIGADSHLWAGPTTVSADADFTVLDIHDLEDAPDNIKRAQYFNILTWAWDIVKRDRNERIILVVDEAWILVDPNVPESINFLRNTSKRTRKFEGSLIVATQNVKDFMDPAVARYGEAIINNATYKLLLRQGEKDLEVISNLMHLSEAETDLLLNVPRGEGLLIAGREKVHLKIEAAEYEMPYMIGGGR